MFLAGCWWLTPVTLATWEAELRMIIVPKVSQGKEFMRPISKITRAKWTGGVAQVQSSELKPQSHK
jgi:hypothetical protein